MKVLLERGAAVNAWGGRFGSALIAACSIRCLDAARMLLDYGADLDFECAFKGKALNVAAEAGDQTLVQLLLDKGADINDPCGGYGGALSGAAAEGHLDMVKMLVAAGANVNLQSEDGTIALHALCESKKQCENRGAYCKTALFLLEHGADPNLQGGKFGTALQAAVVGSTPYDQQSPDLDMAPRTNAPHDSVSIINLLLDYGANVNSPGGMFGSPIRACLSMGRNMAAAHLLIERGAELDDDIFLLALQRNLYTILPLLLRNGIDVNAETFAGSALHLAISNGDASTTELLLDHPDIEVNNLSELGSGTTALYQAVRMGNKEVTRKLLVLGADANLETDKGTCIAQAARNGDVEIIQLLLNHGADLNPGPLTALITACEIENEGLVKFLLDMGANADHRTRRGKDALQTAASTGNENIFNLLLAHGASIQGSALAGAIESNSPSLAHILLDAGAPVNWARTDEQGKIIRIEGPLTAAIRSQQHDLMRLLIERGANVDGFDDWGDTPLGCAISLDDEDGVKLLLEHGADVNLTDCNGSNPLTHAVCHEEEETCDKYMRLLLDAGALVDPSPRAGVEEFRSPLVVSKVPRYLVVPSRYYCIGPESSNERIRLDCC